jgi:negative regulator of sigma E activity
MFDGELPAAECELLSRRIDRDENLRARWSRYALIGAAMRSEPVATARRGFAARVTAALDAGSHGGGNGSERTRRLRKSVSVRKRTLWNTALAASMVTAVAGVSIGMLRYSSPNSGGNVALTRTVLRPIQPAASATPAALATTNTPSLFPIDMRATVTSNGEPRSYVTPTTQSNPNALLRTELADLIVAHSEYSTPLMRRNLLSALVSSEDAPDDAPTVTATPVSSGPTNAASAASSSGR